MKKIAFILLLVFPCFSQWTGNLNSVLAQERQDSLKNYKKELLLMGSRFELTIVAAEEQQGWAYIEAAIAEIERIEALISSWKANSQTSLINKNAGLQPVKVSKELYDLIERSKKVSAITQGAFDISFGSIDDRLWRFDGSMTEFPDSATARQAVCNINYQNILLNSQDTTVFLKEKGMKIGFGAIGKGYAAEQAKALLQSRGVNAAVINAGGDLTAWGQQADGSPWTVGIANPNANDLPFSWLEIRDKAVVTSGNYEKYVMIDGKRYSHIIDPRTGYPAQGLKSVTVICSNAELADALATAIFILGKEVGLDLINQLKGIECIIIDDDDQIHQSENIKFIKK